MLIYNDHQLFNRDFKFISKLRFFPLYERKVHLTDFPGDLPLISRSTPSPSRLHSLVRVFSKGYSELPEFV